MGIYEYILLVLQETKVVGTHSYKYQHVSMEKQAII